MKKALLLLAVLVVSTITLSIVALYALMQTRYAPNVITTLVDNLTPYKITATDSKYIPPLQLELSNVELQHGSSSVQLPKLNLWLSQLPWQNGKLSFDSILIQGASINLDELNSTLFDAMTLHQLALKHVDINAGKWSARGVNAQIESPLWSKADQTLPFGDIQLSIEQLYMQGEALNKVLVDARYQENNSTIFGSSFHWRGATISGQAEQYPQGWSLVNVTIDQLTLPQSSQIEQLSATLHNLDLPIFHINSLDILSSSFNYGRWRFEHLDASLENLNLNQSTWQQQAGYASFDAESIRYGELQLLSPTAQFALDNHTLTIEEFDTDFKQGRIQLQGEVSPQAIALSMLKIRGVKWLEQTAQIIPDLTAMLSTLDALTIEQLEIDNTQLIQVEKKPYWQVSGLTVEGTDLTLIEQSKSGLLAGKLDVSANIANIDKLITTQAHLTAHATKQKLVLERAFIPLEQGYIEASGYWDRATLSSPWVLTLHADGLPLEHYFIEQNLPFSLSGLAEIDVRLNGLSGDYSMLSHSLSGAVTGNIHHATLEASSVDGETSFSQALAIGPIEITADRGRITLTSPDGQSQLAGGVDLTKPQFATLLLKSQQECVELWSDMINGANVIKQTCSNKSGSQATSQTEPESISND
ncbi:membrane assembly protein AsmA [Vibrio galatheae]|uniref:Membrane assembly protein AsmA n=1 Tax=Vibrio galatheae TaxID=579748 RepID=A0A0F4NMN5_9VIBR|nr:AsmA family protein [Vibrio galatheae]KJY84088.1 membrane assembly protein AsmA [Vibrio galatheae]